MAEADALIAEIEVLGEKLGLAKASITRRFIGQEGVVDLVLSALLCGGHGLLIGLPGLGKKIRLTHGHTHAAQDIQLLSRHPAKVGVRLGHVDLDGSTVIVEPPGADQRAAAVSAGSS